MFGDPHFWERALMWATGQEEERDRAEAEAKRRRQKEEKEAREKYLRDNNILSEPILVREEIERYERDHDILPKESFSDRIRRYGNPDRSFIEDRRSERPTDLREAVGPPPPPVGWPNGWDRTYDPRWVAPGGQMREPVPPDVAQGMEEAAEWTGLRARRGDLIDGEYEPTRSPLVLRKRNSNGTLTYVHALTGQPLFDLGEYGLNDLQGDSDLDPYWRGGRREW